VAEALQTSRCSCAARRPRGAQALRHADAELAPAGGRLRAHEARQHGVDVLPVARGAQASALVALLHLLRAVGRRERLEDAQALLAGGGVGDVLRKHGAGDGGAVAHAHLRRVCSSAVWHCLGHGVEARGTAPALLRQVRRPGVRVCDWARMLKRNESRGHRR
jgi:hypothetical protein